MFLESTQIKVYTKENTPEDCHGLLDELRYVLPTDELYKRAAAVLIIGADHSFYVVKNRNKEVPSITEFMEWQVNMNILIPKHRTGFIPILDYSVLDHKNILINWCHLLPSGKAVMQRLESLVQN